MTPKEQKALTAVIQANRRVLALLDRSLEELVKTNPAVLAEHDVEHHQPFLYSAIGSDGLLGMLLSSDNLGENPSFGYIRMHPDSSFVLTRINAAVSFGVFGGEVCTSPVGLSFGQTIGVRMYDESSSRWITFTNRNNEPQQKTTMPFNVLSPNLAFNEGGIDAAIECVFPRSAVVRVEAYRLNNLEGSPDCRAIVVLQGYKVYGG